MLIALGRKLAIPNPLRGVVGEAEEVVLVDEVVLGVDGLVPVSYTHLTLPTILLV